jgi:PAS domain S-box-containing protein
MYIENGGMAVSCGPDGRLMRVLENGLPIDLPQNESMDILLDEGSLRKWGQFIHQVKTRGVAFDWEINVRSQKGIETLHFAGIRGESENLILATQRVSDLTDLFERMMGNGGQVMLGKFTRTGSEAGIDLVDEITRLNNELVNAQRDLSKTASNLAFHKEKLHTTLCSIGDGVIATDSRMRIEFMNPVAMRLTGWEQEEAMGRPLSEVFNIVRESNGEPLIHIVEESLESGEVRKIPSDSMLVSRSGTDVPVFDSVAPIMQDDGRVGGLVIVFQDVKELRMMERRLRDLNDLLRLILKTMRHDLINDLMVVDGQLSLFEMKGELNSIEKARNGIRKCYELIGQMKQLEGLTTSERGLEVYDARDVVLRAAAEQEVSLELEGDCDILADDAIFSVVGNLLRNAVVHGKTDRIEVHLSSEGRTSTMKVIDHGVGIPDRVKERMFEEGYKHGPSGNSGLGLFIVMRTIERYGGTVTVEDNVPGGTIFTLTFASG